MPRVFVRRERWSLTWFGRLMALIFCVSSTLLIGAALLPFLAVTNPVGGQYLVVEGWLPGYAYAEAATLFRNGGYRKIIATGAVDDAELDDRDHFAERRLAEAGVPGEAIVSAYAGKIERDRTFHAALTVKSWLQGQGVGAANIDVVTIGAHARRSRMLFEKALGESVKVGVIAIQDRRFDPAHWWRSSAGVRSVIGETIAYLYSRIFFTAS